MIDEFETKDTSSEEDNPASRQSTKARILDVAEQLFSEKGFAETSMRDITGQANVNLASVNYHFGSKEELINAVFQRSLAPLVDALNTNLSVIQETHMTGIGKLELSLKVLVSAALKRTRAMKGGGGIFMRLLSRAYSDPEAKVRNFLAMQYTDVISAYVLILIEALPAVSKEEIYWRSYSMLGSLIFIMSSEPTLQNIAKTHYGFDVSEQKIEDYLVKFLLAGLSA